MRELFEKWIINECPSEKFLYTVNHLNSYDVWQAAWKARQEYDAKLCEEMENDYKNTEGDPTKCAKWQAISCENCKEYIKEHD